MAEITIRAPSSLDEIWQRWSEIEPFLKLATDRGYGYIPKDVYDEAARAKVRIYIVEDAGIIIGVAVVRPETCPRCIILNVPWLAGERIDEWIGEFTAITDALCKELGAPVSATLGGRDGWHRMLRQRGIAVAATGTVVYREVAAT